MDGAEAERADRQPVDAVRPDCPLELRRLRSFAEATGEQEKDGLLVQPPQREIECTRRGSVEPLDVVDGEYDRRLRSESLQDRSNSDAEGTRIQNLGPTASPRGPRGGVGPGQVGNFIVTGHRTSHSAPFADLPALGRGDTVRVRSGSATYVYRITATRSTSFRSPRSLAEQSAAVPGRPGAAPVRPMITLSTCATPEDHAAGNYWADRFGNPEHRIDKVGVLVGERRAG